MSKDQVCSVRNCPIHGKPPASELVKFLKDGSVWIDLKRYMPWFLRNRKS